MLTQQEKHLYTPEEYLILEEKAEYKSEYHQGEIVARVEISLSEIYRGVKWET